MLTKRIIPCLDVSDGRVVKGLNFKSLRDAGDPVELAKKYSDDGADELVFLDITASEQGRETLKGLVRNIAKVIDIPFTVGGGVGEVQHARDILLSGADKVGVNTGAVKNPHLLTELMEIFGKQCIVAAIDAKRNYSDSKNVATFEQDGKTFWYEVFTYGGKKSTGIDAIAWAKKASMMGAGEILLTSIDADGTKDGYEITLTKAVSKAVSVPVIASGGCGTLQHMAYVLQNSGADAALAAFSLCTMVVTDMPRSFRNCFAVHRPCESNFISVFCSVRIDACQQYLSSTHHGSFFGPSYGIDTSRFFSTVRKNFIPKSFAVLLKSCYIF